MSSHKKTMSVLGNSANPDNISSAHFFFFFFSVSGKSAKGNDGVLDRTVYSKLKIQS